MSKNTAEIYAFSEYNITDKENMAEIVPQNELK